MDRVYKPLPCIQSNEEALYSLKNGTEQQLVLLGMAVGEQCPQWRFAQMICLKLAEHKSPLVRANAVLGMAYIARTKGKLDKRLVKPVILKELKENIEYKWRILDAVEDINWFLKWHLSKKAVKGK